jgi:hypothetical protein
MNVEKRKYCTDPEDLMVVLCGCMYIMLALWTLMLWGLYVIILGVMFCPMILSHPQ